jgi:phosphatidylglycerophosphatase A
MSDKSPIPRLPRALDLLAFGFGSGRSPKAPGTVGSAVAVLWFAVFASMPLGFYLGWVVIAALAGIAICGEAARIMGVHDHGAIVWDEFVGQWIALIPLVPLIDWDIRSVIGVLLGFLLFRLFDIWKPWPISWLDRRVHGGLGIMIDDVIAGIFAAIILWLTLPYLPEANPGWYGGLR